MAPSEPASEKFKGGAAHAAAELGRAVRSAKRAWSARRADRPTAQQGPIDWAGMDLKGWGKVGALSAFRMKVTGQVMFTAGRDVVRPGAGADEGRIF
eukprot:965260-Pleurochrysis_carterae.AAC.1